MESGAGTYIIPLILFYLNLDDFAELAAAATIYGIDLRHFLQNSASLTNQVLYVNHFNALTTKAGHPILNYDRLWQLSPSELLIEARMLNLTWKPLYKTDVLMPFIVDHIVQKPLVVFNPTYDIIALVEQTQFFILSYGGRLRADRGQLIYAESVPCYNVSFMSWNPTGTYLLACFIPAGQLNQFCDRQLVVYKFCPCHGYFKKNILPNVSLNGSGTMLTPCLWIDETSFMWCKGPTDPLLKITLTNYDTSVTVTTLTPNIKNAFQIDNNLGGYICLDNWARSTPLARSVAADDFTCQIPTAIFGNFFALPDNGSPYFYCVLNCPIHINMHDCIGVIKRDTLKLAHLIALPGQIQEIRYGEKQIFILLTRCTNIQESDSVRRSRTAQEFQNCPYHIAVPVPVSYTWWDNKQTDLCWFTDSNLEPTFMSTECCPINLLVHKNRSYRQRCLFDELCDSRSMQITTDFVLLTSYSHDSFNAYMQGGPDIVHHQRIFRNHHYIESTRDLIIPNQITNTFYYHPTKGLVFVHEKKDETYYPYFGLTRSAQLEHYIYLPEFDPRLTADSPFNYPMLSVPQFQNDALIEEL